MDALPRHAAVEPADDRDLGAVRPTPTVGLCSWMRGTSKTHDVTISPGEVVLDEPPEPIVVVQVIGGTLPSWAVPQPALPERPDAELIVLRRVTGAAGDDDVWRRLRAFTPTHRFLVADRTLAGEPSVEQVLPWTTFRLDADASDLDAVAEAMALALTGLVAVCIDWSDLLAASEAGPGRPGAGYAVALAGPGDRAASNALLKRLASLTAAGFDGNILLIQLVSEADSSKFTLEGYGTFIESVAAECGERDVYVTVGRATRSAVVLAAFRRPPPRPSKRASDGRGCRDETASRSHPRAHHP